MLFTRRSFLQSSGVVTATATATVIASALTPAQAYAAKQTYKVLDTDRVAALEALAETLVPGARTAGVAHLVDSQLSAAPAKALLILRYLGVPVDQLGGFYEAGLSNTIALAQQTYGKAWSALDMAQRMELVGQMFADAAPAWEGAPASFFAFVVRADACDVVYGSKAGFERIGMPHMAHIEPEQEW